MKSATCNGRARDLELNTTSPIRSFTDNVERFIALKMPRADRSYSNCWSKTKWTMSPVQDDGLQCRNAACRPQGKLLIAALLADGTNRTSQLRLHRARVNPNDQSGRKNYATLSGNSDLLVAPKAQAAEFTVTEAPRRQRQLERRGFKTKVEPV